LVEQLLNIRQLKTKNKAKDMVVLFIISAHQRKDTKIILQKYFIFLNNPCFFINLLNVGGIKLHKKARKYARYCFNVLGIANNDVWRLNNAPCISHFSHSVKPCQKGKQKNIPIFI